MCVRQGEKSVLDIVAVLGGDLVEQNALPRVRRRRLLLNLRCQGTAFLEAHLCAQQYVGKSQSCMVRSGLFEAHDAALVQVHLVA